MKTDVATNTKVLDVRAGDANDTKGPGGGLLTILSYRPAYLFFLYSDNPNMVAYDILSYLDSTFTRFISQRLAPVAPRWKIDSAVWTAYLWSNQDLAMPSQSPYSISICPFD